MALFVLTVQPMITCLQVASAAKQTLFPNDAGGTGYTTEMIRMEGTTRRGHRFTKVARGFRQ